jgi:hypothetical protein
VRKSAFADAVTSNRADDLQGSRSVAVLGVWNGYLIKSRLELELEKHLVEKHLVEKHLQAPKTVPILSLYIISPAGRETYDSIKPRAQSWLQRMSSAGQCSMVNTHSFHGGTPSSR